MHQRDHGFGLNVHSLCWRPHWAQSCQLNASRQRGICIKFLVFFRQWQHIGVRKQYVFTCIYTFLNQTRPKSPTEQHQNAIMHCIVFPLAIEESQEIRDMHERSASKASTSPSTPAASTPTETPKPASKEPDPPMSLDDRKLLQSALGEIERLKQRLAVKESEKTEDADPTGEDEEPNTDDKNDAKDAPKSLGCISIVGAVFGWAHTHIIYIYTYKFIYVYIYIYV